MAAVTMPRVRIFLLIPLLLFCSGPLAAAPVSWLFDVEVSVPDRSPAARREAEAQAFDIVLQRVTGLETLPENEVIAAAREQVSRFYSQYGYVRGRDTAAGAGALDIEFHFDRRAVQQLALDAGLSLWSLSRPLVVAWVAEERRTADGVSERRLLAAGDAHPLVGAMQRRARERGLPLLVPVMDFEDSAQVSAVDVWGRFQSALDRASRRYGADLIVSGRLWMNPFGGWHADWQVTGLDEVIAFEDEALDLASLGRRLVDRLVARLATRFAIDAVGDDGGPWPVELRIRGLGGFADYAAALGLLDNLEAVLSVEVVAADRTGLHFRVASAAPRARLAEILALDRRLAVLPELPSGESLELVWRRTE